jgi:hypothetical protein
VAAATDQAPDDFARRVRDRRVRLVTGHDAREDADGSLATLRMRGIPLALEVDDVLHVGGRWPSRRPQRGARERGERAVLRREAVIGSPLDRDAAADRLPGLGGQLEPGSAEGVEQASVVALDLRVRHRLLQDEFRELPG